MKRKTVTVAAAVLVVTAACSTAPVDTTRSAPLDEIGNQPGSALVAPGSGAQQGTEQPAKESTDSVPTTTPMPGQAADAVEGTDAKSQAPEDQYDEDIAADIEELLDSLDDLDDLLGGLDDDLGELEDSFDQDEGDIEE